ncbi:hypothetical protein [Flectobacillus longus]|uniref:hypothetical protein n=1 Tax=Flectobacillus longus TaxID=2984207 RepID=UPI0024B770D2|nr:hypothetical protein [Flectobacillus longus]MDI9881559.1 hypothetical protein [Flectobacillus longus]
MIKKLEQLIVKLNPNQKMIFAIVIPIALFVLTMPIAGNLVAGWYYGYNPFNFNVTWWVWLLYVCIVGFIEYKVFEDKPKAN